MYVEGLNMVKRHQRPIPGRPNMPVGVIEKEGPIHVSNVAIVIPRTTSPRASACVATRTAADAGHGAPGAELD